jgi:ABC-2 type transport system permease protein
MPATLGIATRWVSSSDARRTSRPAISSGVIGMFVALGSLLVIRYLAANREDGTLLRARATPDAVRGYVVGKLVTVSVIVLVYLVILLVPAG